MKNMYDNGSNFLGVVKDIKEYICNNCEDFEEIKGIIEDLEDYNETDIVFIDYNRGMGYGIDRFTEEDRIKTKEERQKEEHDKFIDKMYEKMKKYIMESEYKEIKKHYFWYGENLEICGRQELLDIMFESYCNTFTDSELEIEINKLEVKQNDKYYS